MASVIISTLHYNCYHEFQVNYHNMFFSSNIVNASDLAYFVHLPLAFGCKISVYVDKQGTPRVWSIFVIILKYWGKKIICKIIICSESSDIMFIIISRITRKTSVENVLKWQRLHRQTHRGLLTCHVQLSYTATLYKPTNNLLHIQYLSCKSKTNSRSN